MGLRRRLSKKWNELVDGTLTGPGVDVDSVKTDEVTIGGRSLKKVSTETKNTATTNSVVFEFSTNDLDTNTAHFVRLNNLTMQDPGAVNIYIGNDDAAGNGSYTYFDETGTKQAGQDQIELVSTNAVFANIVGNVRYFTNPQRPSVTASGLHGQIERFDGYVDKGVHSSTPPDVSLQIEFTGGIQAPASVELWRAI